MKVPGVPFVQGRNAYTDRDGRKYGIAIHCTDNTASAEAEASYATRRTDGVSSHFYVDSDSVVQSLSLDARAGHAGSNTGNDNAVAVEITGRVSASRKWWLDHVAWDRLAEVLAVVCRRYDITPRRATVAEMRSNPKVRAFYGHNDMRLAWGGTTHTDPGPNFPWDHLLKKVQQALDGSEDDMTPAQFLAILKDPAVARQMRALPWQYEGGGIPKGMSTLGVLDRTYATVRALGEAVARESASPEEIRALLAALPAPPSAEQIGDEVIAGLGGRSPADVAQALVAAGIDPVRLADELTRLAEPDRARHE